MIISSCIITLLIIRESKKSRETADLVGAAVVRRFRGPDHANSHTEQRLGYHDGLLYERDSTSIQYLGIVPANAATG